MCGKGSSYLKPKFAKSGVLVSRFARSHKNTRYGKRDEANKFDAKSGLSKADPLPVTDHGFAARGADMLSKLLSSKLDKAWGRKSITGDAMEASDRDVTTCLGP